MKVKKGWKQLISMLICVALILGFEPAQVQAADIEIANVTAIIETPAARQHPDMSPIAGDNNYTVTLEWWYHYFGTETNLKTIIDRAVLMKTMSAEDYFAPGETYLIRVRFTPKEGYKFAENRTVSVNSNKTDILYAAKNSSDGSIIYVARFYVPEDQDIQTVDLKMDGNLIHGDSQGPEVKITEVNPPYTKVMQAEWTTYQGQPFTYLNSGTLYKTSMIIKQKDGYAFCEQTSVRVKGNYERIETEIIGDLQNQLKVTIYARPKYSIRYEGVAAEGMPTGVDRIADPGQEITLPECFLAVPDGKIFKAWKIYNKEYPAGTVYKVYGNLLIKPVFADDIKVEEISLNLNAASLARGKTLQLAATVTPSNAFNKTVLWKTSNATVAIVDSTGKVTAVAAGTATITCEATDGSGKKATCKITVPAPVVKVTKITLNKTTASIMKGEALTLKATVTPTNATSKAVTWTTGNSKVATVSSTGKVIAVAAGTTTITCTAADGSGVKAVCKITVKTPTVKVTKITLNKTTASIMKGETLTLKATVTPTNAANKAVIWTTGNSKVATVSSTGKVTAIGKGTTTITCKAKDGSNRSATCKITVTQYTNTEAFVARIYTEALNRKPETTGLKYWTNEINTKKRTPVNVAESFFFTPEFENRNLNNTEYVKVLYRTFMGREYDKAGLDYWVKRLNQGESRKSVLKAFAGCPEFKKIVAGFGL